MLCDTQFLLNTVIGIKKEGLFSFNFVNLSFFKSETSLNYSTFDQLDLVKTPNFENNDVIVTSYDVTLLLTRWKLNKLVINCEFSKYLPIALTLERSRGEGGGVKWTTP